MNGFHGNLLYYGGVDMATQPLLVINSMRHKVFLNLTDMRLS